MLWTLRQPFYRAAKLIVKYIRHPVEAGTSKPWELNMSIYGLYDALHFWYLSLKSVLLIAGATKSKFDDTVFFGQSVINHRVLCAVMLMTLVGESQSSFN